MNLITDWQFYVVAVPAVLLLGVSKSGFGAGFGSLAVPLMALSVTVPQAAAILMPVLLVMDLLGIAAFRKDFDRALLKFMLPWGLLGIVIGTLSFKLLEARWVAGIVGVFTLLFLAQRLLFAPKAGDAPPPRWAGALLAATSGFTSFVAHAGGPPINAYVIPLGLSPVRFTGIVPDLFAEGAGAVADGHFDSSGTFIATKILAKHDERYMPPQMGHIPADAGRDTVEDAAK